MGNRASKLGSPSGGRMPRPVDPLHYSIRTSDNIVSETSCKLPSDEVNARLHRLDFVSKEFVYTDSLVAHEDGHFRVRLLDLLPGTVEEPIRAHLKTTLLDEAPVFEALSYTWGAPQPAYGITISGQHLGVTENLKLALFRLRDEVRTRTIWIDAVCINQMDKAEKSTQVSGMRDIYAKAVRTVVWLGEEGENSHCAFQMCRNIYNRQWAASLRRVMGGNEEDAMALLTELSPYLHDRDKMMQANETHFREAAERILAGDVYTGPYRDYVLREIQAAKQEEQDTENPATITRQHRQAVPIERTQDDPFPADEASPTGIEVAAIHMLLRRPWFCRIWIVQEVSLSQESIIQCGGRKIAWWIFLFGVSGAHGAMASAARGPTSNFHTESISRTQGTLRSKDEDDKRHLRLANLLFVYRRFLATDPRDKVYALVGLANDHLDLTPSYCVTTEETYLRTATQLWTKAYDLELLSIPRYETALTPYLPSWVPDWSYTGSSPIRLLGDRTHRTLEIKPGAVRVFSATGDSRAIPVINGNRLHLRGYIVDEITATSICLRADEDDLQQGGLVQGMDISIPGGTTSMMQAFSRFLRTFNSFFQGMKTWFAFAYVDIDRSTPYYPTLEDHFVVLLRTLWTDLLPVSEIGAQFQAWLECGKYLNSLFEKLHPLDDIDPNDEERFWTKAAPFFQAHDAQKTKRLREKISDLKWIHILERRMARTKEGFLCLVPEMTEVGDQVGLLQGGKTPFVLRKAGEDGGVFQTIGEAYVHGFMYGEAWREEEAEEIVLI